MIPTVLSQPRAMKASSCVFSTLLIKPTKAITNADFTVAHQQMVVSYVKAGERKIGDPEKEISRERKCRSLFNFLQDNIIATALVMFISVAVIFLVIGGGQIDWLRSGDGLNQGGLKNTLYS